MSDAPEHAGPLRVIFVGVLLVLTLAGLAVLLIPPPDPVTHGDVQAELFESVAAPLPDGLVADTATKLPTGDRVLVYRSDAEGGPVELTFVEYPVARAKAVLKEQFSDLRFDRGGDFGRGRGRGRGGRGGGSHGGGHGGGGGGKPKLQDSGYFDWHEYKANYARLRHTKRAEKPAQDEGAPVAETPVEDADDARPDGDEAEPTAPSDGDSDDGDDGDGEKKKPEPKPPAFYETMRANLSVGGRCVVAYLRFPDGVEGTTEAMERVLEAFTPALDPELTSGTGR